MKYLITGGAGFIGSHLTDLLLKNGHSVRILDNFSTGNYRHPEVEIIEGDIRDQELVKKSFLGMDACFHLVAIPSVILDLDKWFDFNQINLQGSLNVLKQAVKDGGIPIVYASSCAVYGNTVELPLREDMFVRPLSTYGCDKLALELNAYCMSQNLALPTMGLRFFNVYGPRQNPTSPYSGVITRFITRALKKESPIIFGDGTQTRDFIFVKDVAAAAFEAMSKLNSAGNVINVCTGKTVSIQNLAELIMELVGENLAIEYQERRSVDVQDSQGDIRKFQEYGFQFSPVSLRKGLEETIEFFRDSQRTIGDSTG